MYHSFHTSKMTGTHQEQLIDHLRVLSFFIELNLFLYVVISTHRRQQNPAPAQPASPSPPPPRRRRKPQNPWVLPWILQREERGCYRTLLDELITTDIPGYRNFTRMEPAFFYLIEERITPHLRKSITNFRKPLEVGLKLAFTLRHLSTGESYTSMQYHWRVGRTTICKFVPQVCKAILKDFQQEYLVCPTDPEDWTKIEERFRNRWNVPHAVGALDGKHIAIKKPKKSRSEYFNYKGYFSLELLALVDADYKFLWVNAGGSGSSSDAQIFNCSKLKRRIENGTFKGLPPPEPLGPGGPDLYFFLLGDDAFALMPWLVKPYSRHQLNREERIAKYRISRGRRVVENSFDILVKRFRVMLTTMEQRRKVVTDIVLTCLVLHNMPTSHQGAADRPPTPADDIQPPQADQGEQRHHENLETHQGRPNINETYWKITSIMWGCWLGRRTEFKKTEGGGGHAVIYQSFSGLPK